MAGVAAFTLVSCDDGNEGAIYNMPAEEQGYTFLTESAGASYGPAYTEKTYSFKMARNFAGEAATLALTCEGADPLFTVPSSVEFKAGETMADVVIGIAGMETGKSYNFTLAIDSAKVSSLGEKKGIAKTELTFAVDYTWTKMGVCEVYDDWSEETAAIDLEYAPEYSDEAGNILCRFPNMEYYLLGPTYITLGYHFQFFLAKDTYDPVGTPAVVQRMGMTNGDDGNIYWYYYPAAGHTFTREYNVYTLSGYVGYDEYGTSVKAGWYYNLEFKWTEGWTGDLPEEKEDEPEEEVGNGFGAIVAGGTADDYAGTYTATFLNDGKKEGSAEVTLTKVDDNTVSMTGLFGSKYAFEDAGFVLNLFGGLLYFQPGQMIGKNGYSNEVYAYSYSSETGYIYDSAMLVGGFKENGDIQFVNYSYNDDDPVDGIINIFWIDEDGPYLGADYIPCNIVLKAAEQSEAPAKSIKTVVESLKEARSFFNVKASTFKSFIRK